jgi:hypothetical protein
MAMRQVLKVLPNLLTVGAAVLLAACYLTPFADLDFTWQIRTGEQIVQSGQLRTTDQFTYTIYGQPVPDFEWLYEVILYFIWSALGVGGLQLLKTFLIAAPLLIVGVHLRRQGVHRRVIVLVLLVAVLILIPTWNLRAMFCTTIGLLLVTSWLHDHCTGRKPLDWRLPLVMLLWANLHPGVIAGQGLLLMAVAWEWINCWLPLNRPLDRNGLQRLTLFAFVGLTATFLAPDPIDRLLYPFRSELRHPAVRVFAEMQSLPMCAAQAPFVVLGSYLIAALVIISLIRCFRQYRLWQVGLMCALGLLANLAVRGLQDWLLVMLMLGVPHFAVWSRGLRPGVVAVRWLCWQPGWIVMVMVTLTVVTMFRPLPREIPVASHCPCPREAAEFIREHNLHGKFFAPPNFGSYLGWTLGPQTQVYVDTRGFFFPPQLLEDSHVLPQLGTEWRQSLHRVLDEYPTDFLLLETNGPRGELWQYLRHRNAVPLYLDDETVLLSADELRQLMSGPIANALP